MTISIKPTASGSTIEQDGSTVLSIESDRSVDVDSGTLHVDATNNRVGIGTSSPSEPLSVFRTGGQTEGINIRNTSSGNGSRLTFETTRSDDSSVQEMAAVQVYAIAGYDSAANSDSVMTFETQNSGTTAEQMRLDNEGNLKFNSGYGSVATAYGCRAWVAFTGNLNPIVIRASGNVSSISDFSTGNYQMNFTTAMPDANFCTQFMAQPTVTNAGADTFAINPTTAKVEIRHFEAGVNRDGNYCCAAVFR